MPSVHRELQNSLPLTHDPARLQGGGALDAAALASARQAGRSGRSGQSSGGHAASVIMGQAKGCPRAQAASVRARPDLRAPHVRGIPGLGPRLEKPEESAALSKVLQSLWPFRKSQRICSLVESPAESVAFSKVPKSL